MKTRIYATPAVIGLTFLRVNIIVFFNIRSGCPGGANTETSRQSAGGHCGPRRMRVDATRQAARQASGTGIREDL